MTNIIKKTNGNLPSVFGSVVDQLFQNNLGHFFGQEQQGRSYASVPVNIRESEKAYELELAVPGLKKEDLKVSVEDSMLMIRYSHDESGSQPASGSYVRREHLHQSFTRTFSLDESVDSSAITARCENGILYVTLPKKEPAGPSALSIQVN